MAYRLLIFGITTLLMGASLGAILAQAPDAKTNPGGMSDFELVEKLIVTRRDYQKLLEQLRSHYKDVGDLERARWAEDELRQFHRLPHHAFRLELDVPPKKMPDPMNVPEANKMFTRAMSYKDKGWGTDYVDNQRRAELLLQQMLTLYPHSDKISDAAYMLGDLYESQAYKHYRRAAMYFERCYQWNPTTSRDARIRAARLYDRQTLDRSKAIELYREVTTHETDAKRLAEANKRLGELAGPR